MLYSCTHMATVGFKGSTVNICALDISKAFDRVDHYALLQLLMDRYILRCLIGVLLNWFIKSCVCVRWVGALSLADRTNGRAIATLLRLSSSVVCDVMYCG